MKMQKTSKIIREFMWSIGLRSNSNIEEIEKDISKVLKKHFGYQFVETETEEATIGYIPTKGNKKGEIKCK